MAELKTRPTSRSVKEFLSRVKDARRRKDCRTVLQMMKSISRAPARLWGSSIVGFGSYHYKGTDQEIGWDAEKEVAVQGFWPPAS